MSIGNWIALGAVVVALLTLGWAIYKDQRDEKRRRAQERAVDSVQASQAEVLERLADATKALASLAGGQAALAQAHQQGAQLGAEIIDNRLIVRNMGPNVGELTEVLTPGDPDCIIDAVAGLPAELHPGETRNFILAMSMGTPLPLEVVLSWTDGRGVQQRSMAIMP